MLREAGGALAGEAADGVHTQELTVVLLGGALVQIWRETGGGGTVELADDTLRLFSVSLKVTKCICSTDTP